MRIWILTIVAAFAALTSTPHAQVALTGSFTANAVCPAYSSIKKSANPGNIATTAGTTYRLLGKNKQDASHYWIEVPGAAPAERWVAISCGSIDGAAGDVPAPTAPTKTQAGKGDAPFYVLALSWEPAFCEGLPDKPECERQTPDGLDAKQLSLHGLWPQPRRIAFCNVDQALIAADDAHRWEDLPEPDLTVETRQALDLAMPGTQSLLERHEWIKHGTCYPGANPETYFKDALRLTAAINASPVQAFLSANIGKTVNGKDLRAKFDEGFGPGAGDRVRLACKDDGGRQLLVEVTIGIKGNITSGTPVADLIQASSPTDPGCPAGLVDPAGLQ